MGGAVSSGESNDELIDNLKNASYIKNPTIEKVFRSVDRAMYYTEANKRNAYKDLAWKDGNLHLSAPCIYSEVMENIEIGPGMSFLNLGSGTGYLSTLCGLIIGINGINHGVELFPDVIEYARNKVEEFLQLSPAIDMFDFCRPEFVAGNCLHPISASQRYDRIYCGAACPEEALSSITNLLKVGGICVVPINDSLVKVTRVTEDKIDRKALLPVSFASLVYPRTGEIPKSVILPDWNPPSLKDVCRSGIRNILLKSVAASPQGEEQRKKKRKRKQERRRANRLLVVQRRRSGTEGETGFVAVAYSLENHSSDEEDNRSLPNSDDHSTESLDSDDMLRHQAQIDRFLGPLQGSLPEQHDEEMGSLTALNPNVPEGYHIEDNPSDSNPTVSPYRQSNRNSAVSSSSHATTDVADAELDGSHNLCACSSAPPHVQALLDSLTRNINGREEGEETGFRAGMRQRCRPSRGARSTTRTTCRETPEEMGVLGRVQEQYRRARMDRERNIEEESHIFQELFNSSHTQLNNRAHRSAAAAAFEARSCKTDEVEMIGAMQNPNRGEESPHDSRAAKTVNTEAAEAGNSTSDEPAVSVENNGERRERSRSRQPREEEMWSAESSDSSAMSTDDEETGEPGNNTYLRPRLVSERTNSNRTSGSTDSGVAVNESENNGQSQTSGSKETGAGDSANTQDDENDSAVSFFTVKMTESINTLPIAPTLKSFLNYHRQIDGKYRKPEIDLSFLR